MQGQQDLEQSKCEFSDFFWSYNSNLAVYFITFIYLHLFSEMVSQHRKLIPVNILIQGQQDLEQSKFKFSDTSEHLNTRGNKISSKVSLNFQIFSESYNSNLAVYFIVLIYLHSFSETVSRHSRLIPVNILMQGQQDLEQSKCEFSDFFWSYNSNLAVYFITFIYLHLYKGNKISEMVSQHRKLIPVNILIQGQQDLKQSKCEFSDFFWSYNSNLAVYFITFIYLHLFSEMVSQHRRLIPENHIIQMDTSEHLNTRATRSRAK